MKLAVINLKTNIGCIQIGMTGKNGWIIVWMDG
jgi:hypothetical protein